MSHFAVRQFNLKHAIRATLYHPAFPNEALQGKTVRFRMRMPGDDTFAVDSPATVLDPVARDVMYEWRPGDHDRAGVFYYRWDTVDADGSVLTYPTDDDWLEIVGTGVTRDGLPWASIVQAKQFVPAARDAEPLRVQFFLENAAEIVAGIAPPPVPLPEGSDYPRKAARGELQLFSYFWETQGFKTQSSSGIDALRRSQSYAKLADVKAIVESSMGSYALANKPKKPAAIVSRMVRRG